MLGLALSFWGKLVRSSTMISREEYKIRVSHPLARYYTSTVYSTKPLLGLISFNKKISRERGLTLKRGHPQKKR